MFYVEFTNAFDRVKDRKLFIQLNAKLLKLLTYWCAGFCAVEQYRSNEFIVDKETKQRGMLSSTSGP